MAHARRTARPVFAGPPRRPAALGRRLWTQTLAVVARSARNACGARRRHGAGIAAVCVSAAEHRSCSGGEGGSGPGVTGGPRCRDTSAGAAGPRERAHEAVASRTTGPDDLASLLAMLDLRAGPQGNKARPEDGGGRPGRDRT
ncbi:hypothetical protein [Streptomyces sp. NPDC054849]